jgi:hypothetical protein
MATQKERMVLKLKEDTKGAFFFGEGPRAHR